MARRLHPDHRHRIAAVGAVVGILLLSGCGQPRENQELSGTHGRTIEQDLIPVVRAAGWDSVGQLREQSCLGDADPQDAARQTKWLGTAARESSQDQARRQAEEVARTAESLGWTPSEGHGAQGDRLYGAEKDELTLVVRHRTGGGHNTLSVAIHSPCLDMPEGHTMTRSEYDPMYGSHDPLYPNDDSSKFTNGQPKPFPEDSGTGAEGSST